MIIQEWRGMAARSNADAYPKHFRDYVVLSCVQSRALPMRS
jgi:hypothetical protein